MGSVYGKNIKVSIFGQSHSAAIGVVVDNLPAGLKIDLDELRSFIQRRAPGRNDLSTPRREGDEFEVLAGLTDGRLNGAPFAAVIRNTNIRPDDYAYLADTPRPGHADYTAELKFNGAQDRSGGGHFSGRLTAPLCIAGGICLQLLKERNIYIGAHIERIGDVRDVRFDPVGVTPEAFSAVLRNYPPVIDAEAGKNMSRLITETRNNMDSIGGVIECAVTGLPAGVGEPMFDGLENRIAAAVFAIPAVKGIEFGSGFDCAGLSGSENNDPFIIENGQIKTSSNNHGGILGGISSGMPVIFRAAFKPTPSIGLKQRTVSLSRMEETELEIRGRHDPCIVIRAVPCVEAAAAIAVYDLMLQGTTANSDCAVSFRCSNGR
jgi:chorismate synthase